MDKALKILIIGGYGNVGRKIVSNLHPLGTFLITIAGRNVSKATEFTRTFNDEVKYIFFDVNEFQHFTKQILEYDIILSCIDLPDIKFAEFLIKNGKIYLDLTANSNYVNQLESLNTIAHDNNGLAVLCIGLMPGLSNLMVKYLALQTESITRSEIFVQLGMGEKNGKGAIQWVMDNVNKNYEVHSNGKKKEISPLENGKYEIAFEKRMLFFPFNFSDQHVIHHTLNIPETASYLGFESNFTARMLSLLKKIGFFKLIKYKPIYNALLFLLQNFQFGGKTFRLKAKIYNVENKINSISIKGKGEALITAQVASQVIIWIGNNINNLPAGIKHIEQLLSYGDVISHLKITATEESTFSKN